MQLSLTLTDSLLCLSAGWAAIRAGATGQRLAFGLIALASLLGVLRFSGVYPLPAWHELFTIWGGSAALPLLALSVRWPASRVAVHPHEAWLFLLTAMAAGLLLAGLARFRMYDQALGALAMLALVWTFWQVRSWLGLVSMGLMLGGSMLFLLRMHVPGLEPGDFLHLGMALGLQGVGLAARPKGSA
jgi:hypothetical protein